MYEEEFGGRIREILRAIALLSASHTSGYKARILLQGWEALETPRTPKIGEAVSLGAKALDIHREDGIHMKNTGKRIFFSIVAFGLANLAIVVSAGAFTSQR